MTRDASMAASAVACELSQVSLSFGEKPIFSNVSAQFEAGCFHVVVGASGAGKTTLLRLLMGSLEPSHGTVARTSARVAAVFQEDRLVEGLTPTANVRLVHHDPSREAREAYLERAREALRACGLSEEALRRPVRTLSGGQRRRVALVRALLTEADVVVLDEPIRGLDAESLATTLAWARPYVDGRTVVWATHHPDEISWVKNCCFWRVAAGRLERISSHSGSLEQ